MAIYQFRLEQLLFRDGTRLDPTPLTVILGPNNVGKSALLKEIVECITIRATPPATVLQSVDWTIPNSLGDLLAAYPIKRHRNEVGGWIQRTLAADLSKQHQISSSGDWPTGIGSLFTRTGQPAKEEFSTHFGHEFVAWLTTEQRLRMVSRGDSSKEPHSAWSILQLLYGDLRTKEIESKIRSLVKAAFGLEIALDFTALQFFELRVGDDFSSLSGDPRTDRPILSQCQPLDAQGDGIRSFVGIVAALEVVRRPLILIDEPEAFLHPPRAFQIGAFLARAVGPNRQILVATHSGDFLRGVLSVTTDVTIARLDRRGTTNTVKILDPQQLRTIASDALLSSARVFDGLFYRGAVVVEADRDGRFYQAGARKVKEGLDLHFVNADSKQTIPRIMSLYKQFDVSCAGIVDFDVLNDSSEFAAQLNALDLRSAEIGEAQAIRDEIERYVLDSEPKSRLEKVKERLLVAKDIADNASGTAGALRTALRQVERECLRILGETKAWRELKQTGRSGLPEELASKFERLYQLCAGKGLFINPAGELESMLTDYGVPHSTDKSGWFQQAIGLINGLEVNLGKQPWRLINDVIQHLA